VFYFFTGLKNTVLKLALLSATRSNVCHVLGVAEKTQQTFETI
jgi:hypothetical protein